MAKKSKKKQETKLVRVKKKDINLLKALAKKLSLNGHDPYNAEIIHYILMNFEDNNDIGGGIERIFSSIRSDIKFLFQKYEFSPSNANKILEQVAFFQAIILQQVTGNLPIPVTSEILKHIPSAVKLRIKNKKEQAEMEATNLRKAAPEVP